MTYERINDILRDRFTNALDIYEGIDFTQTTRMKLVMYGGRLVEHGRIFEKDNRWMGRDRLRLKPWCIGGHAYTTSCQLYEAAHGNRPE